MFFAFFDQSNPPLPNRNDSPRHDNRTVIGKIVSVRLVVQVDYISCAHNVFRQLQILTRQIILKFCSAADEGEAQPRAYAVVFVQRFQPQRADVRIHGHGRVPDVRSQLRATVAGRSIQLRATAGRAIFVRATSGHTRLLWTAAFRQCGTADVRRRR